MTVAVLLVRHAAHDDVGAYLAGRTPGIRLGDAGRAQAARLGERMAREPLGRILSSPRERTRETAEAIAAAAGAGPVETAAALDEVDFGPWSGRTFEDLDGDLAWRRWNAVRGLARTPAGESMLDVARRAFGLVEALVAEAPERPPVLVSHADVIKAVVLQVLGLGADAWPRLDIAPASVSRIEFDGWSARVTLLNQAAG